VDNGSTDDSVAFVRQHYPEVEVLPFAENRGFAAAVNAGIQQANTEYVVLLNPDTIPQPDWLANLVHTIAGSPPEVGGLASKMLSLSTPDLMDDAGDTLSWYGSARKRGLGQPADAYTKAVEVFSTCAGAALYRRCFLSEVGGFDESFGSYLEDIDVGLRGRLLGYRYLYVPDAQILHQSHGAAIARSRYIYLMTRNRLALLVKNIPWELLVKYSPRLIYGQVYFFLVYKRPLHSLAGILSFVAALPHILRQRQIIQKGKRISNQALETMLSDDLGEPPLSDILRTRLRWD
ncbi:MAG: glycosyltransferase family 2 protein, partial [Chloroflexi bacterium]|nr:glycosyltransferase family 2 protein [Chloroflexota bacterium]